MDATVEPTVRLRLRSGLLGTAAVTSFVSTLPLFGVLYWFGVRGGTWLEVLIVHAIVVVGCFAVGLSPTGTADPFERCVRYGVRTLDAAIMHALRFMPVPLRTPGAASISVVDNTRLATALQVGAAASSVFCCTASERKASKPRSVVIISDYAIECCCPATNDDFEQHRLLLCASGWLSSRVVEGRYKELF